MKRRSCLAAVVLLVVVLAAGVLGIRWGGEALGRALHPKEYSEYVEYYADKYRIDPLLLYSFICTESGFDPDAESSVGARGLMQLMPSSFEWLLQKRGETDKYTSDALFDPAVNIDYGAYLLRYFYDYYGTEQCAVAAYNAGFVVSDWLADSSYSPDGVTLTEIPYPETSQYVDKVESAKSVYIELYYS